MQEHFKYMENRILNSILFHNWNRMAKLSKIYDKSAKEKLEFKLRMNLHNSNLISNFNNYSLKSDLLKFFKNELK